MPSATPALVFCLMLIAPCAVALWGDKKKKAKKNAAAQLKVQTKPQVKTQVEVPVAREAVLSSRSGSVPVFTPPPAVASAEAISALRAKATRIYTADRSDPYAIAASLYAQPASSYVEHAQPIDERSEAEALLAQAAAAKAKAAALAEAARAAQAKAQAAAETANRAARVAAMAHQAAEVERDIQAQITAEEQKRTASGEHTLPATHPSLDFPRSGRQRRVA